MYLCICVFVYLCTWWVALLSPLPISWHVFCCSPFLTLNHLQSICVELSFVFVLSVYYPLEFIKGSLWIPNWMFLWTTLAHPYSLDGEVIFGQKLQNILASAQKDLTKDKIGAKVGEMTSFARQDCLFCGRGWDSHGWGWAGWWLGHFLSELWWRCKDDFREDIHCITFAIFLNKNYFDICSDVLNVKQNMNTNNTNTFQRCVVSSPVP